MPNISLLTWVIVVVAVIVFIAVTLLSPRKKRNHPQQRHRHHPMVEFGKEKDEFFIPGDPLPNADDDNDNERDNNFDRS